MKSRVVAVLCLVSLVAICGVVGAGSVPLDNEDFAFCTDSVVPGPDGGAIPSRIPKTGQTTSYRPRDDGALEKGMAWPNPRFTDRGDGTVRDNLTSLIWLKRARCITFYDGDLSGANNRYWGGAITAANKLADGYCGLTDGSNAGQWRLPNVRELLSLVHFGISDPALPDTAGTGQWTEGNPFTQVAIFYWTSTTSAYDTGKAMGVYLRNGIGADPLGKFQQKWNVWPVRGPE